MNARTPKGRTGPARMLALVFLLAACTGGKAQAPGAGGDAAGSDAGAPGTDAVAEVATDAAEAPSDALAADSGVQDAPADVPPEVAACQVPDGKGTDGPGPHLCFVGCAPAADALVVDVPKPPPETCPEAEKGLHWDTPDGQPLTPPTLQVELGTTDPATGTFQPYVDGQWVPIVHGVQGGIHVWAAFRTSLPAKPKGKAMMDASGHTYQGCKLVGSDLVESPKAFVYEDPHVPGKWTNASTITPGLPVAFEKNQPDPYCGLWVRLNLQVRDPTSGQWGQASRLLRLYDAANL